MSKLEQLLYVLKELESQLGEKESKRLELAFMKRVILRTDAFAQQCTTCQHNLEALQAYIQQLNEMSKYNSPDAINRKDHKDKINQVTSHLKNVHKLLTEGYYTGIYMSLGVSLGVVFGLTLMDNIALGMPIGVCFGLGIGAGLDADAKKKGKMI